MTATIAGTAWAQFIRDEYVNGFIRDGGSAIKFVVATDDASKPEVMVATEGIEQSAQAAGYVVARVSAEDTRIHMMDQLFFRVAEQIVWSDLTRRAINRIAAQHAYAQAPIDGHGEFVERLAAANNMQPDEIRLAVRPLLMRDVGQNRELARDFRVAASHLCLGELAAGAEGESTAATITDWLTGRNTAVAAVRPYQLFTRIHRTNARHLFTSLLRWLRFSGYAGLVVVVDIARVSVPSNPRDGTVFYTKAAMFDAYEVLRQFIDATDEMDGLLMVLTATVEFLDQDSGRGLGAYEALKFRVFDEVRDQRMVNPMSALVRVASAEGRA